MRLTRHRTAAALLTLAAATHPALADEPKRHPTRFAIVYNEGYGADNLPTEPDRFEKLVKTVKDAHFNVILCQYEPWRAEICRKHGVQILVDLLVPKHHVYKSPDAAKKLCESLRDCIAIYGYHLWSDNITDTTVAGRARDVKNVHEWDPSHPTYVGTMNMNRVNRVDGLDVFGYYDFHWTRGSHWTHLNKARQVAAAGNLPFLRYDDAAAGVVGKGNLNRVGYTFATSVPFGLKGYLYHHAATVVNPKTFELEPLGEDLKKVNTRFEAVGDELIKIGVPSAVYSTSITKNAKNDAVTSAVPEGLSAVPSEHWYRIVRGEVLVGHFADADKRDVLVFACHNPYESQEVRLELAKVARSVEVFETATKKWALLPADSGKYSFRVEDYGARLVRVTR